MNHNHQNVRYKDQNMIEARVARENFSFDLVN